MRLNSVLYIMERRHLLSQLCPTGVPHLELLSLMRFCLTARRTPWALVSHSDTAKKATFRCVSGRYLSLNCRTPQNICVLDIINQARCYGRPDPNTGHITMRNIDQKKKVSCDLKRRTPVEGGKVSVKIEIIIRLDPDLNYLKAWKQNQQFSDRNLGH